MAKNVYTTYELAKDMAEERMNELEQDIFICSVNYPSGKEFILKTYSELMSCANWLYMVELPFKHQFNTKGNAVRESKRFAKKMDKEIEVEKITYEENGYNKFSHYTLCLTSPQ